MVLVFVHHAQNTNRRLIGATKSLQQLVMLGADFLSHLARGYYKLVLHQGREVVVRLKMNLTVGGQAEQAGLHSLLLAGGAEITQDIPRLGLDFGLVMRSGSSGFPQAAVFVQVQSARTRHVFFLLG